MSLLNPQQQKALDQSRKLLTEHFDSWIISYKFKNENNQSAVLQSWQGDSSDVLGLTVVAQKRVIDFIENAGRRG